MSELAKKFEVGGHGLICLASSPEILPDIPDSDWDLFKVQGFTWYTDFIAFNSRGESWSYLIEVRISNELILQTDVDRTILLPYTIPSDGIVLIGTYMDPLVPIQIPSGEYKILFQTRFLTDQEIESSGHYDYLLEDLKNPDGNFYDERRPELCIFTFIPTQEKVKPEILYPTYESIVKKHGTTQLYFGGFDPRTELVLHNAPRPAGYD